MKTLKLLLLLVSLPFAQITVTKWSAYPETTTIVDTGVYLEQVAGINGSAKPVYRSMTGHQFKLELAGGGGGNVCDSVLNCDSTGTGDLVRDSGAILKAFNFGKASGDTLTLGRLNMTNPVNGKSHGAIYWFKNQDSIWYDSVNNALTVTTKDSSKNFDIRAGGGYVMPPNANMVIENTVAGLLFEADGIDTLINIPVDLEVSQINKSGDELKIGGNTSQGASSQTFNNGDNTAPDAGAILDSLGATPNAGDTLFDPLNGNTPFAYSVATNQLIMNAADINFGPSGFGAQNFVNFNTGTNTISFCDSSANSTSGCQIIIGNGTQDPSYTYLEGNTSVIDQFTFTSLATGLNALLGMDGLGNAIALTLSGSDDTVFTKDSVQAEISDSLQNYAKRDSGSFTITLTGCSTTTTGLAHYSGAGNSQTINIPALSCTSNATTATLTGFPAITQTVRANVQQLTAVENNSVIGYGSGSLTGGTMTLSWAVVSLVTGGIVPSTTFTNSGTKAILASTITVQTQ